MVRKPWQLSIAAIGELTDWQILNVYFRPGDADLMEDGVYWPLPVDEAEESGVKHQAARGGWEAVFKGRLRDFGWFTEGQIESRWEAYLKAEPGLARYLRAAHGT